MCKRAARMKAWAEYTVRHNVEWAKGASESSIEMLGERLSLSIKALAENEYRYLETRSHGVCSLGAVDSSATRVWQGITGRKIGSKSTWKYDHTVNITSAYRVGKVWHHPWLKVPITKKHYKRYY